MDTQKPTPTIRHPYQKVTLDGVEQRDVTFANAQSGIVRRLKRTPSGALIKVRGQIQQVTLFGKVTIE